MEPHQTNQKKHINPESTPHLKKKKHIYRKTKKTHIKATQNRSRLLHGQEHRRRGGCIDACRIKLVGG